jgi:phenylpropionate dioxygenase-like ring-hydroxylating dioxygenase large terminal subunit
MELEAHYSFLVENLMDMHHGHLHASSQAWTEARLQELHTGAERIDALYDAFTFLSVNSILSPAQLLLPFLRRRRPVPLRVSYVYPHWVSSLGEDFRIVCLLAPESPTRTRAYLIHFTSLKGFRLLQQLPMGLRRWIRDLFFNSSGLLLRRLVAEDRLMIEEEQRRYHQNPRRRPLELNPALLAVQSLITAQTSEVPHDVLAQG